MNIIESGPAGGVVGAQALARAKELDEDHHLRHGRHHRQGLDGRGRRGRRARTEYAVGAGIMIGSRLLTGAGYTLKVPAIDLAEVGAGGGSHVWIDAGGALQVGPGERRRLARPGLLRQGRRRRRPSPTPTCCWATSIPAHLVGGALKLNAEKARAAFAEKIAKPLGMPLERAAYGAHLIAASNMIRAIKAVSTERGRDPREFALFAFGGNGPLFAAGMAAALGISRIVVPPSAGLFSSFGLLYADVEHHYARTFRRLLRQADLGEIDAAWDALARQASEQLAVEGFTRRAAPGSSAPRRCTTRARATSSPCRCPTGRSTPRMVAHLEEAFGAGARAHLRPSRRPRRAGRAGGDPARRLRACAKAAACRERVRSSRPEPRRAGRRARPISATSTAGSKRRCCAAPISAPAAPGR